MSGGAFRSAMKTMQCFDRSAGSDVSAVVGSVVKLGYEIFSQKNRSRLLVFRFDRMPGGPPSFRRQQGVG